MIGEPERPDRAAARHPGSEFTSDAAQPVQADSRIAVIGMVVRAPGARTLEEFWRISAEGREAITFFGDDDLDAAGVPRPVRDDPHYVAAGAPLSEIDLFDAAFFNISPSDAEIMDPQLRAFLEAAWQVIETAGYDPQRLDVPVGVYGGAAMSTYLVSNLLPGRSGWRTPARAGAMLQLNERDALTTYVSYKLDLHGPSVAVQTMCSTSLVAVHLACQALRTGECDMALAGGASINVHQSQGYLYEDGLYFSPDGHTRPFDADARGTVFGSGVGIVLLKRLAEAVRDGDQIHGIILGSALNNDGAAKAGFTAPSAAGQAAVITEAQAAAGVTPDTISYLETHGTGTPLGDAIEIAALKRAFRRAHQGRAHCALGSAKANFGHLDKAAGVIGLIKACLALEHAELPPIANYRVPNPQLDLASSPFYIRTVAGDWHTDGGPRRAGVSSFGIGGTNAHVVLEQAPAASRSAAPRTDAQLLTWSARTPDALDTMTDSLADVLQSADHTGILADVAYVQHVGRSEFPCRRTLVARTPDEAVRVLRTREADRMRDTAGTPPRPPDVIFMFPGGGAQHDGMVRHMYAEETVFRHFVDRAHDLAAAAAGLDLRTLLTEQPTALTAPITGTAAIDDVLALQVALFTVEYALAQQLLHWGIKPRALIGHSTGEYVAACVAGVISFDDAVNLLLTRGQLMRSLPSGGMLAIQRPAAEVREMTLPGLYLTAVNGRRQCVVSGPTPAIAALRARLDASGVDCQPLSVGIASHSALMEPMVPALRSALQSIRLQPPRIPFVSCATGNWARPEQVVQPSYWIAHLTKTVLFGDALATVDEAGSAVLLEVGPGRTLSNLALAERPSARERVMPCIPRPDGDTDDRAAVLDAAGKLWLTGMPLDWENFHAGDRPQRIALPTYPFERRRFWIDPEQTAPPDGAHTAALPRQPDRADWYYLPAWRRTLRPAVSSRRVDPKPVLLVAAGHDTTTALASRLRAAGHAVVTLTHGSTFTRCGEHAYTIRAAGNEDYADLLDTLNQRSLSPGLVVHCASLTMPEAADPAGFERCQQQGLYDVGALIRGITRRPELLDVEVIVVTAHADQVHSESPVRPERAVLQSFCRVVPQEYPTLRCRHVDVDGDTTAPGSTEQLAAELLSGAAESVVAYRGAHRYTRAFDPVTLRDPIHGVGPWRPDGVYLITGGLGTIGAQVTRHIVSRVDATVVLLGRNATPDTPTAATDGGPTPLDTTPAWLHRARAAGARIHTVRADVSDPEGLAQTVAQIRAAFGGLNGVIHAAASFDPAGFRPLKELEPDGYRIHFAAKVHGLYALEQAVADIPELEFCLLLSSLSAHLGGLGHAGYAAANRFMDAFAQSRSGVSNPRWISVDSELWGAAQSEEPGRHPSTAGPTQPVTTMGASLGGLSLSAAEGTDALDRVLRSTGTSHLAISTCDLNARYRQWAIGERHVANPDPAPEPRQHERSTTLETYQAPRTQTEVAMAGVWADVLGFERIGVDDDFFRLGGHSITAIRIVARLRDTLRAEISVADLLTHPTVAQLTALITDSTAATGEPGRTNR